jgi:CRP-like cAMP-binding protein
MSRQIGEIPTRTFNAGDVIFRAGDDAKGEAFLVHQGRVEIRIVFGSEERVVNTLTKGQLLGEFALWRDAPRSATAVAVEPVTLMLLPANRLDHMVRSNGALAVALIRDLANRMLAAEERMRTSEARIQEAEQRAEAAEQRAREAEQRAREAQNGTARPA